MGNKKIISILLIVCMVASLFPASAFAAGDTKEKGYYQSQLGTEDARAIYEILDGMDLKIGTDNVILENVQVSNRDALYADYVAARDAYMMDHHLFYVDFDKLSISQEGETFTIGTGRSETYFQEGFDEQNIEESILTFEARVEAIADEARLEQTMQEQVKAVYDAVIDNCEYALEADVQTPGNEYYVRTSYGALVTREAVCAGYAMAMKAILDELGIESVLVQGMYDDGSYKGPHMWNYVRMDDHRWYMLDATMEDGLRESTADAKSESFFLITGLDPLMDDYQPNGVISLSSQSMEFSYPDLSIKEYEDLSDAFEPVESNDGYKWISYKGLGLEAAQQQIMEDENGESKTLYILSSTNGSNWYYYKRACQLQMAAMGDGDPLSIDMKEAGLDTETAFVNLNQAYFGVTTVAPSIEYDKSWSTIEQINQYQVYEGGLANIHDISLVGEAADFDKLPPYITEKIPYNSRLDQGKTYEISVTYSEPLKKANTEMDVKLTWVKEVNDGKISDFKWWGDSDVPEEARNNAKVTFTLTTGKNFGRTVPYYFELQNLIGRSSNKVPNAIGFSTYNHNTYDCPKVDWDITKIHSNTPALVANEDISTDGWLDADGKPFTNLPTNFSLVATTIENQENDTAKTDMMESIQETLEEGTVLAAQTYDISLSLCSNQVAYIEGKPLQVYVPFPDEYNYEDYANGETVFKAYHFDDEGNPEEIRCEVVESGIIMYCSAFSPYAVVAMQVPEHSHDSERLDYVSKDNGTHDVFYQCGVFKSNQVCSYGDDRICDGCGSEQKQEEDMVPTPTPTPTPTPSTSSGSGFSGRYNYPVQIGATENGEVKTEYAYQTAGELVVVNVEPKNGYGLKQLIITDEEGNSIPYSVLGEGKCSFMMPEGSVKLEAEFEQAILLTIGSQLANVFGMTVKNDVAPILTEEGRTMIPIRFIAEAFGADVDWDPNKQTVTITKDGTNVTIVIGEDHAFINGKKVPLDAPAFIENGRTYLPLRFVAEALGATVNWDATTRQITILK